MHLVIAPSPATRPRHIIGDQAEQAYRRSDALERRRELMQAWANFLDGDAGANVIRLRSDGRSDS
jgi:hypothetical protein